MPKLVGQPAGVGPAREVAHGAARLTEPRGRPRLVGRRLRPTCLAQEVKGGQHRRSHGNGRR
eukprot:6012872-Lingulodinium_polyedra.AAC.1